jgi:hypothetical protein
VHALTHHHPGFPTSKLHPHFTKISFPPQENNKTVLLRGTEVKVLNVGPKFVPPAPKQVLERLPKEIAHMKTKVATAWRKATKTIGREPPIVNKFCQRIEEELKKSNNDRNKKGFYNRTNYSIFSKNAEATKDNLSTNR